MRIDDPAAVARQYATEANLEARRSLYDDAEGPDPRELAFQAVAEVEPDDVLEVGHSLESQLARIQPLGVVIERAARLEIRLGRVLPGDRRRIVDPHGNRIGAPGIPRLGALPPSQAFTVAPTSANSPSCTRPAAFLPAP